MTMYVLASSTSISTFASLLEPATAPISSPPAFPLTKKTKMPAPLSSLASIVIFINGIKEGSPVAMIPLTDHQLQSTVSLGISIGLGSSHTPTMPRLWPLSHPSRDHSWLYRHLTMPSSSHLPLVYRRSRRPSHPRNPWHSQLGTNLRLSQEFRSSCKDHQRRNP